MVINDDVNQEVHGFEYEKQHYSLSEIARMMKRPRTTLKEWADLFKEFLPTTGYGRTMRYKKEAIELFQLIAKMKDANEPNQQIRDQLSKIVTEIVVEEKEQPQGPYIVDVMNAVKKMADSYYELSTKYADLKEDVEEIKEMVRTFHQFATQTLQEEMKAFQETAGKKLEHIEEQARRQSKALNEKNDALKKELEGMKKGQEILLQKQEELVEQQKQWQTITQEEIQSFVQQRREEKRGFWNRLFKN